MRRELTAHVLSVKDLLPQGATEKVTTFTCKSVQYSHARKKMYSLLRDSINFLSQINSSEVYAHTASRKLIFCYGHVVESVYTNKIVSILN